MAKKRILIADDEKAVRMLLADVLKLLDHEIDMVENGAEAIDHIDRGSYDLIITDYMMPEINGLELTQRIKARYPSIPILVITGNGPVEDLMKSGATSCISKPFNIFQLQEIVRTILNEKE